MESKPQQLRTYQMRGEAAQKVFDVILANRIRNDQRRQQDDPAGRNGCICADDVAGDLETLQLGIFDLAINLRKSFESAHRKYGMAKCDDDGNHGDRWPQRSFEPTQAFLAEL